MHARFFPPQVETVRGDTRTSKEKILHHSCREDFLGWHWCSYSRPNYGWDWRQYARHNLWSSNWHVWAVVGRHWRVCLQHHEHPHQKGTWLECMAEAKNKYHQLHSVDITDLLAHITNMILESTRAFEEQMRDFNKQISWAFKEEMRDLDEQITKIQNDLSHLHANGGADLWLTHHWNQLKLKLLWKLNPLSRNFTWYNTL